MEATEINGILSALTNQRNSAMDQVAKLQGELAVLWEKNKALEAPEDPLSPEIQE